MAGTAYLTRMPLGIAGGVIGASVVISRVYSPANLGVVSGGNSKYYDITELLIGRSAEALAAVNISVAFNESASCKPENIVITVNT